MNQTSGVQGANVTHMGFLPLCSEDASVAPAARWLANHRLSGRSYRSLRTPRKLVHNETGKEETSMKVKTHVKGGRLASNHSQTATGLKVRTQIKGGRLAANHSQTAQGLKVRTQIKGGKLAANHSQTAQGLKVRTQIRGGKLSANHNQTRSG